LYGTRRRVRFKTGDVKTTDVTASQLFPGDH
jgi:hypothetical protein